MNLLAEITGKYVWAVCITVGGSILISKFITDIIAWWREKDGRGMRSALMDSLGKTVTLQCGKRVLMGGSVTTIFNDGFRVLWENPENSAAPVLFYVPFSEIGGVAVSLSRSSLIKDDGTRQVFDREPYAQHYTVELRSLPQHWSVKKEDFSAS